MIGDEELSRGVCSVRDMASGEQREVRISAGPTDLLRAVGG